jgi:ribosomal protein S18 acetylase RimI-like enzyme
MRSGCSAGSELLRRALMICSHDPMITEAELHVQASNAAAIRFYQRHGFEIAGSDDKYYRMLPDSSAVRLRKELLAEGVEVPLAG